MNIFSDSEKKNEVLIKYIVIVVLGFLIYSNVLSEKIGLKVYLKYEGLNPTGSFKDRGMTMAISKAKEKGMTAVACAST